MMIAVIFESLAQLGSHCFGHEDLSIENAAQTFDSRCHVDCTPDDREIEALWRAHIAKEDLTRM